MLDTFILSRSIPSHLNAHTRSGVVVPGEVGILLIYNPNFFFTARERMNDLYHKE